VFSEGRLARGVFVAEIFKFFFMNKPTLKNRGAHKMKQVMIM